VATKTTGGSYGRGQKGEAITLVLRQLSRRLGEVSPELESTINDLALTQLEDLAEDVNCEWGWED